MSRNLATAVLIPVYGAYDYARITVQSLLAKSPACTIRPVIVDDGSPDWTSEWLEEFRDACLVVRQPNRGLTAAWNRGFEIAFDLDVAYIAAVNSDLRFTSGWHSAMVEALDDYELVGPLSNAAGPTARGLQDVKTWYDAKFQLTDDPTYLDKVARQLRELCHKRQQWAAACEVNGFCMMAKKETWLKFAEDAPSAVIPTPLYRLPSGKINPWPTMAGQESWLSKRLIQTGSKSAAALSAYVFHYRSVSRGLKHAQGDWCRKKN